MSAELPPDLKLDVAALTYYAEGLMDVSNNPPVAADAPEQGVIQWAFLPPGEGKGFVTAMANVYRETFGGRQAYSLAQWLGDVATPAGVHYTLRADNSDTVLSWRQFGSQEGDVRMHRVHRNGSTQPLQLDPVYVHIMAVILKSAHHVYEDRLPSAKTPSRFWAFLWRILEEYGRHNPYRPYGWNGPF